MKELSAYDVVVNCYILPNNALFDGTLPNALNFGGTGVAPSAILSMPCDGVDIRKAIDDCQSAALIIPAQGFAFRTVAIIELF